MHCNVGEHLIQEILKITNKYPTNMAYLLMTTKLITLSFFRFDSCINTQYINH